MLLQTTWVKTSKFCRDWSLLEHHFQFQYALHTLFEPNIKQEPNSEPKDWLNKKYKNWMKNPRYNMQQSITELGICPEPEIIIELDDKKKFLACYRSFWWIQARSSCWGTVIDSRNFYATYIIYRGPFYNLKRSFNKTTYNDIIVPTNYEVSIIHKIA